MARKNCESLKSSKSEARTIAAPHLLEAIQYRSLDRRLFY